jgi:hypothetical protein
VSRDGWWLLAAIALALYLAYGVAPSGAVGIG